MEGSSPEINKLKRTINKFITPHAAVFSTERVKNLFVKYGLTPAEFLRPFGVYNGVTYYDPFPDTNNPNNGKLAYPSHINNLSVHLNSDLNVNFICEFFINPYFIVRFEENLICKFIVEVTDFRLDFYDHESIHGFENSFKVIDYIMETYKPKIALEEKDWSIKENIDVS